MRRALLRTAAVVAWWVGVLAAWSTLADSWVLSDWPTPVDGVDPRLAGPLLAPLVLGWTALVGLAVRRDGPLVRALVGAAALLAPLVGAAAASWLDTPVAAPFTISCLPSVWSDADGAWRLGAVYVGRGHDSLPLVLLPPLLPVLGALLPDGRRLARAVAAAALALAVAATVAGLVAPPADRYLASLPRVGPLVAGVADVDPERVGLPNARRHVALHAPDADLRFVAVRASCGAKAWEDPTEIEVFGCDVGVEARSGELANAWHDANARFARDPRHLGLARDPRSDVWFVLEDDADVAATFLDVLVDPTLTWNPDVIPGVPPWPEGATPAQLAEWDRRIRLASPTSALAHRLAPPWAWTATAWAGLALAAALGRRGDLARRGAVAVLALTAAPLAVYARAAIGLGPFAPI